MFNFLVTAEDDAWTSCEHYEFDKSRFLEYTDENIASAFRNLSDKHIDTLKSYPCLFAYEGRHNSVRIGYLTSIKNRGRTILIEFNLDQNIPAIPFSAIEHIESLLDIRNWEMNPTHWAVKNEDLFARLRVASLIPQFYPGQQFNNGNDQPIPHVDEAPTEIRSLQDFIGKVLAEPKSNDMEIFYRGHSDRKRYKLEPSLFRKDDKGNYLYLDNEHILYRELLVSNSSDFSSDEYTLDRLVRMQHYSLPTRLLDITSNPLIALYFACRSKFGKLVNGQREVEKEGEVIVFTMKRENVKYFDSDTASCIANLARLPKAEKDAINFSSENFNDQRAIKRLTHFIREEKPFFDARIDPIDLKKILCVKGKKSNSRITSQSGAFLIFGLDAIFDETGDSQIQVSRIGISNKTQILRELDQLNINESTVFPYIENSARYVADKYAFKNYLPLNC